MLNEFDIACSNQPVESSPLMQSSHIQCGLIAPMHLRSNINQLHVRLLSHSVRPGAPNDVCDDICSHLQALCSLHLLLVVVSSLGKYMFK